MGQGDDALAFIWFSLGVVRILACEKELQLLTGVQLLSTFVFLLLFFQC